MKNLFVYYNLKIKEKNEPIFVDFCSYKGENLTDDKR